MPTAMLPVLLSLLSSAASAAVHPIAAWDLRKGTNDTVLPIAKLVRTVGSPEATRDGLVFHGEGVDGLLYDLGVRRKLAITDSFTIWVRAGFAAAMTRPLANHDTLVSRWGVHGEYSFLLKADHYTDALHLDLSPDGKHILAYDSGHRVDRSGTLHDLAVVVRLERDVSFYLDGRLRCTLRYPLPPKSIFDPPGDRVPFAIGFNSDPAPAGDHETMNGTIQAVRVYAGALAPEVIARLSSLTPQQATAVTCRIDIDATRPIGPVQPPVFGQFVEHFQDQVYGGVFQPGSPRADRDGFRTDVLDALQRLQPSVIRWPGGNFTSAYHWRAGAGPRKDRTAVAADPVWHQAEPNTFGTPEFVALCRRLGAEPLICVGVGRDPRCPTADEAAAWVRYCNATAGPEVELRKSAGHPDPFNVRLWGLGNEVYGNWQVGYYQDPRLYAEDIVRYAKAMRGADPQIRFIICGDSYKPDNTLWNRAVLTDEVVRLADWISYHSYTHAPGGPRLPHEAASQRLMQLDRDLDAIAELNREVSRRAGRETPIQIAVDEWNEFSWGDLADNARPEHYDLAHALFTAGFLNLLLRHADQVTMANYSPLVNARGLIAASDRGVVLRTSYHVFEMYRPLAGGVSLPVTAEVPALEGSAAPVLDAAAVRMPDGNLCLAVVNRHVTSPISCTFRLKGFAADHTTGRIITAGTLAAFNSFEHPAAVLPRDRQVALKGNAFNVLFAPRSVTMLRLAENASHGSP